MENLYLREINKNDMIELCAMCNEIKNDNLENNFEGLTNFKDVDISSFSTFLQKLEENKKIENIKPHLVNQTTFILVDDNDHIYGGVNIRHRLNDNLLKHGGHIGALIRPSERRKGYATIMIGKALEKCKELNIEKVLITCREENFGSKKSIEKNNGIYENSIIDENSGLVYRRYWINI